MPVFFGNTATNATSTSYNISSRIVSFTLANKTGGAVTASVGVLYGSTFYFLYNKSIALGDSYVYLGAPIDVPPTYQISVTVSGSTDYYFTIE